MAVSSYSYPAPATGTPCAPPSTKPGKSKRRLPYDIVATSFDGRLDLLRKYVESSSILTNLRSLGVTILHNVDATALDTRVVSGGASLAIDEATRERSSCVPPPSLLVAGGNQRFLRNTACCSGVVAAPQQDRHSSAGKQKGEEPNVRGCERQDAAAGGSAPSSSSSSSSSRQQYDHVIFNHPHTGTEDMRRHRSFLGHFFHALLVNTPDTGGSANGVAEVTSTTGREHTEKGDPVQPSNAATGIMAPGGTVHVTLAGDQPERWGLREQASRHGFSLVHRRRFPAERIDGFMTKRHQTGRSFQRRNLDSVTLSFAREETLRSKVRSSVRKTNVCVGGVFSGGAEGGERCGDGGGEEEERDASGGYGSSSLPPWLWPGVDMCGKGVSKERGADAARDREQYTDAEQHGDEVASRAAATASPPPPVGRENSDTSVETSKREKDQHSNYVSGRSPSLPEACSLCGKRYKTAQAVRTHTRQVHELGQEGGEPLAEGLKAEPCPHCDRVFTSARALDQHVSAKHSGDHVDIKPDWFVGSIYHADSPLAAVAGDGHDDLQASLEGNGILPGEACSMEAVKGTTDVDDGRCCPVETSDSSGSSSAVQCGVCGFWFLTQEDARQHLDNLRPPIEDGVARYECQSCPKEFGSRRALLQHANFCNKQVQ